MIQALKNLKLKFKILICFFTVILLNALSGGYSYKLISEISDLVYTTYDEALMSSTFSQAAKSEYYKFDLAIKSGLVSENEKQFLAAKAIAGRALETLKEDLAVVKDRALDQRIELLVDEVEEELKKITADKDEILERKLLLFQTNQNTLANARQLWMEWDDSTDSKKLSRKLTLISDEASVIGYQFRLDSQKKNETSLRNLIAVVALCVTISVFFALFISYLLVSPLIKLQKTCIGIAKGDYSRRAEIDYDDEVGDLAKSFNSMLEVIEEKNLNIRSLLSALPFGLFYFDKSGSISNERSEATLEVLDGFEGEKDIRSFFSRYKMKTNLLEKVLDIIFNNKLPFDSAVGLLPQRVSIETSEREKQVDFVYNKKTLSDGTIDRVIVIAKDVTLELESKEKIDKLTQRVQRISRASEDIDGFRDFLDDTRGLFQEISVELNSLSNLNNLKRHVHSIKSVLDAYYFSPCVELIHDLESLLSGIEENSENLAKVSALFEEAKSLFEELSGEIISILSLDESSNYRQFDLSKMKRLSALAKEIQHEGLSKALFEVFMYPADKVFRKYVTFTSHLSTRLDDREVRLVIDEDSDCLSLHEAQLLEIPIVHLIKNSADHGVETQEQRRELGKADQGTIKIKAKRDSQKVNLVISDDGRGIDVDKIALKAVEKNLWSADKLQTATLEEKKQLIFLSDFSTKSDVTEISGRGVGMDAVKEILDSHGGSISYTSRVGEGTEFQISIPVEVL